MLNPNCDLSQDALMTENNMSELQNNGDAKSPILWVVVPCFNEQEVLPITAPILCHELENLIDDDRVDSLSKICFVDDGSQDETWSIIENLAKKDKRVVGVKLSRNRGHQNALLAGLMEARNQCDISVSIDCDGQDDITAIGRMVEAYLEGADVVYGVRSSRESDTAFKRLTAETYYRVLKSMGADVVFNHADYRLLSAPALDALSQFGEVNLYLRGIIPQLGFPTATVEYERDERKAGKSHYPLKKMVHLAVDGITSLSVKPIRMIAGLGLIVSLVAFLGIIWAVAASVWGMTVPGWASLICLIALFGGIQLFSLGIIGEYIGKIYLEVKNRPRYIIEERTWKD